MTFDQVMAELKSLGREATRNTYRRHGAGENVYGVSFADYAKLRKRIKTDHDLAVKLWKTGNLDARILATMIADPARMGEAEADAWAAEEPCHMVLDQLAGNLVARAAFAPRKLKQWTGAADARLGRAGWSLLAALCREGRPPTDSDCDTLLKKIETAIHKAANRVREAMNNAVIAIGLVNDGLKAKALATAGRIGKVEIDHGDTSCKTPDAAEYILKSAARKGGAAFDGAAHLNGAADAKPSAKPAAKTGKAAAPSKAKPAAKAAAKPVAKAAKPVAAPKAKAAAKPAAKTVKPAKATAKPKTAAKPKITAKSAPARKRG